jgi:hypothetical protein
MEENLYTPFNYSYLGGSKISTQFMKWEKPSQVIEALKKIGVRASYIPNYHKLIIRGQMKEVVLGVFSSITIYQNNIEILFTEFKKTLRVINEDTGDMLYIYLPKKSQAGYYKDYLWIMIA